MIKVGSKAPKFSLQDQNGATHTLSQYQGKKVLLYFYPKDDTPGCTVEACSMRDNLSVFNTITLAVVGISTDGVASHKKFADKFQLNFPLLSDEAKIVVEAYGVWGKKSFMGKEYMGTNRMSFLIAPDGTIAKIYPKVKPDEHAAEVERDVAALSAR